MVKEGFREEAMSLGMGKILFGRAGGREHSGPGNACRGWESGKNNMD